MLKRFLPLGLAMLLSACGGGTSIEPNISQIKAQTLQYGRAAVIYVAGQDLRNTMTADTGSCLDPLFRSDSTPQLAILTCKVTVTGPLPVSIRSASGDLLYTVTLTVPPPQVTLLVPQGTVVMELYPDVAPITVNNFLGYMARGYYKDTLFHRVIAGFVAQGGGYTTGLVKKEGQLAPIALESNKGLSNVRGSVAMARTSAPDSATSEFFVNLVDNAFLDYQNAANPGYAVFGKVVQGMDVVDAIAAVPTNSVNGVDNVPTTEVPISLMFQTK